MDLSTVHQGVHRLKKKKRVGRGIGSGHGKTASRGHKGQYASAGAEMFSPLFEGGQTPQFRRTPKRGFSHAAFDIPFLEINVGDLDAGFDKGGAVTLDALKEKKILKGRATTLRVLGNGDLSKALKVTANHVTKSAREKIEKAGGTVELLPPKKKPVRNKMKPKPSKSDV